MCRENLPFYLFKGKFARNRTQANSDLDTIKAVLTNLKDEYQEVVIWHYIDDLSIAEIAKMLKKSEGAVRVTLHRALKAVKKEIGEV